GALQLREHVQHDPARLRHRRSCVIGRLTAAAAVREATGDRGRLYTTIAASEVGALAEQTAWKPLSLFHFTLAVVSLERSIAFYTAVGFRVLRNNADVIWPDYVATQFGLECAQGRGALLAIGDDELHTRLDLI